MKSEELQEVRLAELEARVAEAEAREAEANARAERARDNYPSYRTAYDYFPNRSEFHHTRQIATRDREDDRNCRKEPATVAVLHRGDQNNASSHTAEAFSGQNWLVWLSSTPSVR